MFTGYTISHEHDLITAHSHDEYQKCNTIVVLVLLAMRLTVIYAGNLLEGNPISN
ncbi:MAG: hypothetical protein WB815_09135 [Nitrososphaeraceae archaeon]